MISCCSHFASHLKNPAKFCNFCRRNLKKCQGDRPNFGTKSFIWIFKSFSKSFWWQAKSYKNYLPCRLRYTTKFHVVVGAALQDICYCMHAETKQSTLKSHAIHNARKLFQETNYSKDPPQISLLVKSKCNAWFSFPYFQIPVSSY